MNDAPIYVDFLLVVLMFFAGAASAIGYAHRRSTGILFVMLGWFGLFVRAMVGVMYYGGISIALASVLPLILLASGTVMIAIEATRK